jgi:protein subunit release factor B
MYESWADRTGRNVTIAESGSGELEVDGLATFDLLAGEAGLHRHVRPDRTEALARVVVATQEGTAAEDVDPGIVVRVYEEGKRRGVRDPRTDARESHVGSVLADGRIDPFLIAWLRQQQLERGPVSAGRGLGSRP